MRAEVTIEIARAPEDVFAYLVDVANLPAWQSGVHTAQREGDRIHETRTFLGRELHTTLEVTYEEPPRRFALRALDSPVPFEVRHELEPLPGGGTRLTVVGEGETPLLGALLARRAERQLRKDFARLKLALES